MGFVFIFVAKKVLMGVLHLVSVGVLLVLVANVTWGLGSISLSPLMDQVLCIILLSLAAKSSVILFLYTVILCLVHFYLFFFYLLHMM